MKRVVLASLSAAVVTYAGLGNAQWSFHIPTSIASYYDSAHARQNVFFIDAWGATNVLQYHPSTNAWTTLQISNASSAHNCAAGTTFAAYFDGSQGYLYCNDSNRHLLEFAGNPPAFSTDITAATSSPTIWGKQYAYSTCQGTACVKVAGLTYPPTLGAYHVPARHTASGEHVFYPADDGTLHESYYDTAWHDRAIEGPGAAYDPGQSYTGGGQGLTALWDEIDRARLLPQLSGGSYEFSNNGTWSPTTLATRAQPVPISFLASTSPANQQLYVYGANARNGAADVLTFFGAWSESVEAESGMTATNPNIAYSAAGLPQFFYLGSDRHVRDGVSGLDITLQTSAVFPSYDAFLPQPPADSPYLGNSNLTGFWDGACRHIFYVAGDGHVHELDSCESSGNSWHADDLMPNASVPAAN